MFAFQRRTHPTWHFTAVCIGVCIGVAVAGGWQWGATLIMGLLGVVLGMVAIFGQRRWLLIAALTGGVMIGVARGNVVGNDIARYDTLVGSRVRVAGVIADDVDTNPRGHKVVKLKDIRVGEDKAAGNIWVTTGDSRALRRSDALVVTGKATKGFGSFALTMYDARIDSVERSSYSDVALEVRDTMVKGVRSTVQEPAASLGVGYLLGQKSMLSPELSEALVMTGLTHIVVASGYNLTILVRLARKAFENVSKYLAALSGVSLIVGFIAITGMSPSMSRAGLVAGLSLWAWYYGRKMHPVTLLVFAMAVTLLVNPSYAWGDVGWALSFAAFAGVMILAPLLQAYLWGKEAVSSVGRIVIETTAAIVMTMPITATAFGNISIIALFANVLIVPFVPLAMLLTFIAGVTGSMFGSGAHFVGVPVELVINAMVWIINRCAEVPWAQLPLAFPTWSLMIWYTLLALVCLYLSRTTRYRLRDASIIE